MMRTVPTSEKPWVPNVYLYQRARSGPLKLVTYFQLLPLDTLVWFEGGTSGSTLTLISQRETVSWKPELDLGKISILFACSLRGRKQSEVGLQWVPRQMKGYSLEGMLLSGLKINKGLDLSVAQLKCRLLGRLFHLTSGSNSRSEAVHYNCMSF